MSTCGRPAAPNTSAIARETKPSFVAPEVPYWCIGSRIVAPSGWVSTALPSTSERLKPFSARIHTVETPTAVIRSTALMICTQVVPFMPPMST